MVVLLWCARFCKDTGLANEKVLRLLAVGWHAGWWVKEKRKRGAIGGSGCPIGVVPGSFWGGPLEISGLIVPVQNWSKHDWGPAAPTILEVLLRVNVNQLRVGTAKNWSL